MTLREKIISIIRSGLTADETILSQERLDEITDIILEAEELCAVAANIFGEEGANFVEQVSSLFGRLPLATPRGQVFPKAANLLTFLRLANKLDPDELDVDVPVDLAEFSISEAQFDAFRKSGHALNLYIYEHPGDLKGSVAFLDLRQPIGEETSPVSIPHRTAACVSIIVGEQTSDLTGKTWVVSTITAEQQRIYHCKYHLLLSGFLLTNPVFAPSTTALMGIPETLRTTDNYNQFSEPFEILGEINSRTTVLDTLLSCYHVLENYMIRAQIVKVVDRSSASTLFGIRHFKQMEISVQNKEAHHLNSLIKMSWDKQIGGKVFRDSVWDMFQSLFNNPAFVANEFHDFLEKLGVRATGQQLALNNLNGACDILPKLLYQVRCSIVHNKETEFHLSNRELSVPTVLLTLTDLCLPAMQRLAFGLPSVAAPNPLRYAREALNLY